MGKPKQSKDGRSKSDGPKSDVKKPREQVHETGTMPLRRLVSAHVDASRWTATLIEKNPRSATKALNMVTARAIAQCMDLTKQAYADIGYAEAYEEAIREANKKYDERLETNQAKQKQLQEWKKAQKALEEKEGKPAPKKTKVPPKPRRPKFVDDEASDSDDSDSESCSSDSMDDSEESE